MKEVAGQAWEVRTNQRERILERTKQKIRETGEFLGPNFYFMLHHKFEWELFPRSEIDDSIFPKISPEVRAQAHLSFVDAFDKIRHFQRSEEEGNSILAYLFVWIGNEMAETCHAALRNQARENPMLVYGVKNSVDLVPIE